MKRILFIYKPTIKLIKWFGLAALLGCNSGKNMTNSNHVLVRQIGERFDQKMLKGKYQEHFGRYE